MKNINYDLIKLLHTSLDKVWRLEKFYVKDAEDAKCHSVATLKKMLEDEKRHAQMLRDEIRMRMDAGIFN